MRTCLSTLSKFVVLILATLLVLATILMLLFFNFERQVFSADYYKSAFIQVQLYDRLPALIAEQIVFGMNYNPCEENPERCEGEGESQTPPESESANGPPEYLKNLTLSDWEIFVAQIAPPDWLQSQTENIIDQIITFLESDTLRFSIPISMLTLKARLSGEEGTQAVLQVIRAQPACTPEQLNSYASGNITLDQIDKIMVCQPPEEILTLLIPTIETVLDEAIETIPDVVNLGEASPSVDSSVKPTGEPLNPPSRDDPRPAFRRMRTIMRSSPLLVGGLVLLITLFGVRSFRSWLGWWGVPFLIAGLIGLALAMVAYPIGNSFLENYLTSGKVDLSAMSPGLVQASLDVLSAMGRTLAIRVGIQAGIIALLSAGMLIVSLFVKPKT